MTGYQLDVPELRRRLNEQRTKRGMSWRDVAEACGLNSSTLSRMRDEKRPDADALVSLLVWLEMDTDIAYVIKPKEAGR